MSWKDLRLWVTGASSGRPPRLKRGPPRHVCPLDFPPGQFPLRPPPTPPATHRGYTERHVGPPTMGAAKAMTPWTGVTAEQCRDMGHARHYQ